MLVSVGEATDARLRDYVALRDSQLRQHIEAGEGLFIAEGEKIIRRAAEAGCQPRSFLLQERWLAGLDDVLSAWSQVPCYVVSGQLAEEVSGFHVHRGALASFRRPAARGWDEVLTGSRIMVVQDIVDHANLGGIIRSAAGLGWNAVVLSSGSADPLYRRAIKASMGASLQLPWKRMETDADLGRLRAAGFQLVASSLGAGSVPLTEFHPAHKVALLLGTEGHGLTETWLNAADAMVTIPMAAGIDSLNVASAASIFGYVLGSRA